MTRALFFILVFSIATASIAQKRATIGLKGGYGFSRHYFVVDKDVIGDIIDADFIPVYNTGIVFNYLDRIVGVQIGVQYIKKGWKETFNNGNINEQTLDYLEFPVLTHIRFGRNKKSGWVINFGIYGGYVIETNEKLSVLEPEAPDVELINYDGLEYNTFEYGIKAGGGYEIGLGKNSLQLELMFTQGMLNLFETDRLGVYRSLSQTLTFSAIYKFTLFRKEEVSRNNSL